MRPSVSRILRMSSPNIIQQLADAGCDAPKREAEMLAEYAAGDEALFSQMVARRVKREPMSQILGERGFWDHDFIVTKDVLTPRPDSEVLIEEAMKCLPNSQQPYEFLDLGTGSGCLLLTLLHEFKQAKGLGIDKSEAALAVAKRNAAVVNVQERVTFQQGNWASRLTKRFDLVISNPPYIPQAQYDTLMTEVRDYEPKMALIGADDGLGFYREIINQAPNLLGKDGWLIFEVGQGQADEVVAVAEQNGFDLHKIRKDYGGIERAVVLKKK